jgi:hypothetical protein
MTRLEALDTQYREHQRHRDESLRLRLGRAAVRGRPLRAPPTPPDGALDDLLGENRSGVYGVVTGMRIVLLALPVLVTVLFLLTACGGKGGGGY